MDEGWHVDIVAGLGSQPHLMPALRIDELGTARDDIDAGFALAVVMRTGSNARRDARLAHPDGSARARSEEHTSELQSHLNLVCRLLLEKKKTSSDAEHK